MQDRVEHALQHAGENRSQIERALVTVPDEQRAGMRFLVEHMPEHDLQSLSADFLLANVQYAYRAWNEAPWKVKVPEEVFLNDVLPYASINERRDDWRKDFYERFQPLVAQINSPGLAAARLNQQVFGLLNVKYSTARRKADQSPYESVESGLASCTGLSVILVDACRAVGIPARIVGTPRWTDNSGNHTWVEVWDDGWHFTGACEASDDALDSAWFIDRAAQARQDDPHHAIFAVSYRRTGERFPLVWNRRAEFVSAVNVTDRYARKTSDVPEGMTRLYFRAVDSASGQRVKAWLQVINPEGTTLFVGATHDESFDANDHLALVVPHSAIIDIKAYAADRVTLRAVQRVTAAKNDQLVSLELTEEASAPPTEVLSSDASRGAVELLARHLTLPHDSRAAIQEQSFADVPLTRTDSDSAGRLLWEDHRTWIQQTRAAEMEQHVVKEGELQMPFHYQTFGDKPPHGRSLFISMHGGGNAPARVNDRQWENQKTLYQPEEGVYLAPRAPTNTWNLWHERHIDRMFDRLIENLVVFEEVDPNRVYLLGYSAGGDGVFQLAPRMADRLAAAAMMAGHPNETSPLGLRNIGFTLHMGADDDAYNRNTVAAEWKQKLAELRAADPEGYDHLVEIHADKGHWMGGEDAAALPWMAKFTRNPFPKRVVWKQDDVTHDRIYWLAVAANEAIAGAQIVGTFDGAEVRVTSAEIKHVIVRLNDAMLNLDAPVKVFFNDKEMVQTVAPRTITVLAKTLAERGDPSSVYSAELTVSAGE